MAVKSDPLSGVLRRGVGHLSRRLERPELLAAFDRGIARSLREQTAARAVMSSVLGEASTYVDIGTNRGQLLRWALASAPKGEHIAFEPIPGLADELRRAYPTVECRTLALSDSPGRCSFCYFRGMDGWSGLRRRPEVNGRGGRPEMIDVAVSTLDMELSGVTPRLIKIDVEGAEYAVLIGGLATIAAHRPVVLFEHEPSAASLYGYSSEALWELLTQSGYRIFAVTGEGPFSNHDSAPGDCVNWVAFPR